MLNSELMHEKRYGVESESKTRRWRLILADDHKILLEGLRGILGAAEFDVVAEVEDGRSLVNAAADLKPDLIVADFTMPLRNGLEASRQNHRWVPGILIQML